MFAKLVQSLRKPVVEFKGYNLLLLSHLYVIEYEFLKKNTSKLKLLLKLFSLDTMAKWFLHLRKRGNRIPDTISYLFVNEVANNAMVDSLGRVYRGMEEESVELIVTNENKRLSDSENYFNVYRCLTLSVWFKYMFYQWGILFRFISNYKAVKRSLSGIRVNSIFLLINLFDSLLVALIIENMFKKTEVKKIVLNTDFHKLSRAIVLGAKEHNIPTYVLQHGAHGGNYGMVPPLADRIFTWGKIAEEWFMKMGGVPGQFEISGSPRHDEWRMQLDPYTATQLKSVLVVMNPISPRNVRKYLEMIKEICESITNDVEVTIKLRSNADYDLPESIFAKSNLNYTIIHDAPILDLIKQSDIVFNMYSTVGVEAMIYNKPVVQVDFDNIEDEIGEESYGCALHINERDYMNYMDVFNDPQRFNENLKNYGSFLHDYFYKLDGNSTGRCIELLK